MGPLRRSLRASSIESSTSIEGYSVAPEEAVALVSGERLAESDDENRRAVACYARAMSRPLADRSDRCHRQRRSSRVPGARRRTGSRPDGRGDRLAAGRRSRRQRRRPRGDGAPARHLRAPVPRRQRAHLPHRAVPGARPRGTDVVRVLLDRGIPRRAHARLLRGFARGPGGRVSTRARRIEVGSPSASMRTSPRRNVASRRSRRRRIAGSAWKRSSRLGSGRSAW